MSLALANYQPQHQCSPAFARQPPNHQPGFLVGRAHLQAVYLSLILRHRPELLRALFATSAAAPPGMWEQAAQALEPTPSQRVMLLQLWETYAGERG